MTSHHVSVYDRYATRAVCRYTPALHRWMPAP